MSAAPPITISAAIPMWNEEKGLARCLDAVEHAGAALKRGKLVDRLEIVVCDDGSTDATPTLLAAWAASGDDRQVVTHERNRGLGAAVRSALEATTGDLVLYMDADLPFDLEVIDRMIELQRQHDADAVTGYRFSRDDEGPRRFAYSVVYNALVRAVLGVRTRDVNFSCKLVTRQVLDHLDLRSEGSFIDVEMLTQIERRGGRVIQLGVDYRARSVGVSTLSSGAVVRTLLRELAEHQRRLRAIGPRPARQRRGTAR